MVNKMGRLRRPVNPNRPVPEAPMKSDVQLSTRFATTQNAHQVGMLVTLAGEAPARRAPINVALVLDRSSSMDGMPIFAARARRPSAAYALPTTIRPSTTTYRHSRCTCRTGATTTGKLGSSK